MNRSSPLVLIPCAALALSCGWGGTPDRVELPTASAPWEPAGQGITVTVRPGDLGVNGVVVQSLAQGVVAEEQRSGLVLSPLHDALLATPSTDRGRIRLEVDGTIPHGTVLAVVYTTAQANASEFELEVTRPDGSAGALRLCPPALRGGRLGSSDWCTGGAGTTDTSTGWVVWSDDPHAPVPHLVLAPDGGLTLVDRAGSPTYLPAIEARPDLESVSTALDALHRADPASRRLDLLVDRAVPWAWVVAVMGAAQSLEGGVPRFPLVAFVAT